MVKFKASSNSDPKALAGALANACRENGTVVVEAIGASAVNQVVKSVAIARGYLAPIGKDLVIKPNFIVVDINEKQRTAMQLLIECR